jgi:NTE family protein
MTTPTSPVRTIPDDDNAPLPSGIALCLSGGGYRAMVFHLGALWRLNELGFLPKLARISSVSGGSITAGVLGFKWKQLQFDATTGISPVFAHEVVDPVRALAGVTLDVGDGLKGLFMPGSIADYIAASYRKYLFGAATLQDLPDAPLFVINSTNVQTGSLWRFAKPYMADWQVGLIKNPTVDLAVAVGASSAFPPVLSPAHLTLDPNSFEAGSGGGLQQPPYTTNVLLTDGGVYDNLGLETAWKNCATILVSDGGAHMAPDPTPHTDWVRQALRVNDMTDNQVRDLRQRQLIGSFTSGERKGTYWATRSNIANYPAQKALACPFVATQKLAAIGTRLAALDAITQQQLVNWGYAICDAAMRSHVVQAAAAPAAFPYPSAGV